MTVNVAPGQVAVPTPNNTGSTLCTSDGVEQVTLTAASGSNPRIDLVTCHPRGNDLDGGANTDFIFDYVTGTPAASPAVPAIPAGQVALAQILVPTGAASIIAGNITDVRPGGMGGAVPASFPRGYITSGQGPATQTDYTTVANVISLSVPVVLGRRYEVIGYGAGTQQTAASWPQVNINDDQGQSATLVYAPHQLLAGEFMASGASLLYTPTSTKTATLTLSAGNGGGGAFRIAANVAKLWVKDIGTG
jgi:hypothetical protein